MPGKQPRIICLDDEAESLHIRKKLLELFGCQVTIVEDPQVFLRLAMRRKFDLALLDYNLGGDITGEDVARDLRIRAPHLALVMLTGDPKVPESAKACVDAVLTKGVNSPGDLFATIQGLLPRCVVKACQPAKIPEFFAKS